MAMNPYDPPRDHQPDRTDPATNSDFARTLRDEITDPHSAFAAICAVTLIGVLAVGLIRWWIGI